MKRRAFTLAEILIAVGIIGVISAVMLPMVSKYKPDEIKIKYLQTYNSLVEIMPSIVNNKTAYPLMNEEGGVDYNEKPLLNMDKSIKLDGEDYSRAAKFCRLVAMGFQTTGNINCKDVTYDSSTEPAFNPNFTTVNGVDVMIQPLASANNYKSDIYIDVNGKGKGSDCLATSEACQEADRFKFIISADGKITAADVLGQKYLEKRTTWKMNKDDYVTGPLN